MKKDKNERDIEICKRKIISLLDEYNCVVESENYENIRIRDLDTDEDSGINC